MSVTKEVKRQIAVCLVCWCRRMSGSVSGFTVSKAISIFGLFLAFIAMAAFCLRGLSPRKGERPCRRRRSDLAFLFTDSYVAARNTAVTASHSFTL